MIFPFLHIMPNIVEHHKKREVVNVNISLSIRKPSMGLFKFTFPVVYVQKFCLNQKFDKLKKHNEVTYDLTNLVLTELFGLDPIHFSIYTPKGSSETFNDESLN